MARFILITFAAQMVTQLLRLVRFSLLFQSVFLLLSPIIFQNIGSRYEPGVDEIYQNNLNETCHKVLKIAKLNFQL